jgi:chromosome segregation ATPase
MSNTESDTTVMHDADQEIVTIQNTKTQKFSEDDFVQVYEDNLTNYENLLNKEEQMEEQREQILNENTEELAAINFALGNDTPYEEEIEEIEDIQGQLDDGAFEKHKQLEQIKQQMIQLKSQKDQLEEQLDEMSDVAEMVGEEVESFEPDQG